MNCEQRHCSGWSETPLDELVDGLKMLRVRSSGRVAGSREVWQNLVWQCLAGVGASFLDSLPGPKLHGASVL